METLTTNKNEDLNVKPEIFDNSATIQSSQSSQDTINQSSKIIKEHKNILPYILLAIIVVLIIVLVVFIIKRPKPNTEELTKLKETFETSRKELKNLEAKNKELKDMNSTLTSKLKILDDTNQDLMKHSQQLQSELDEQVKANKEIETMKKSKAKTFKERKQELFDKSNQYIRKIEVEKIPEEQPTEIHLETTTPIQNSNTELTKQTKQVKQAKPTKLEQVESNEQVKQKDKSNSKILNKSDETSEDIDLDDVIN